MPTIYPDTRKPTVEALRDIAQELRTANLLTAALVLNGDAGSLAGEIAAERLGLETPADEEPTTPTPYLRQGRRPQHPLCTASHTIEIDDVEDKGARAEWVGKITVHCDKRHPGTVHSGLIHTDTETVRWTWQAARV